MLKVLFPSVNRFILISCSAWVRDSRTFPISFSNWEISAFISSRFLVDDEEGNSTSIKFIGISRGGGAWAGVSSWMLLDVSVWCDNFLFSDTGIWGLRLNSAKFFLVSLWSLETEGLTKLGSFWTNFLTGERECGVTLGDGDWNRGLWTVGRHLMHSAICLEVLQWGVVSGRPQLLRQKVGFSNLGILLGIFHHGIRSCRRA